MPAVAAAAPDTPVGRNVADNRAAPARKHTRMTHISRGSGRPKPGETLEISGGREERRVASGSRLMRPHRTVNRCKIDTAFPPKRAQPKRERSELSAGFIYAWPRATSRTAFSKRRQIRLPLGPSPHGRYTRRTRCVTAHNKSEVTVPIDLATALAGNTLLPSVP